MPTDDDDYDTVGRAIFRHLSDLVDCHTWMQNSPVQIEFIRFSAADGVQLMGWMSRGRTKTGVLYVHGRAGNGYENRFVDAVRSSFERQGHTFLSIDTRGRGVITHFVRESGDARLGGSCYEVFEESAFDIQGAIDCLNAQSVQKFILIGHSLGASKVANFALKHPQNISSIVLIAPTDMVGWAAHDPQHNALTAQAQDLMEQDKPEALVSSACWNEIDNPLSARTYLSVCQPGTAVDIYGHGISPSPLSRIRIPTAIIYGDRDVGISEVYGSIEDYQKKLLSFDNPRLRLAVIEGAEHGFQGYEEALARSVLASVEGYI